MEASPETSGGSKLTMKITAQYFRKENQQNCFEGLRFMFQNLKVSYLCKLKHVAMANTKKKRKILNGFLFISCPVPSCLLFVFGLTKFSNMEE